MAPVVQDQRWPGPEAGCGAEEGPVRAGRKAPLMWKELAVCLGILGKPWASSSQMRRNSSSKRSRGGLGSETRLGSMPHL